MALQSTILMLTVPHMDWILHTSTAQLPFKTPQIPSNRGSYPHTILYYTILYYTILYYTILYYTILYYTLIRSFDHGSHGVFLDLMEPWPELRGSSGIQTQRGLGANCDMVKTPRYSLKPSSPWRKTLYDPYKIYLEGILAVGHV